MKAALQALQFQMAAPGTNPCHTPYWDGEYDGVSVREPILSIFEKSGGSGGKFGFPKSPAVLDSVHPDHYLQEFEGGVIQSFD